MPRLLERKGSAPSNQRQRYFAAEPGENQNTRKSDSSQHLFSFFLRLTLINLGVARFNAQRQPPESLIRG